MTEEATGVLAQFAASLRYEDLPSSVKAYCKIVLLDTLACAIAGHLGEETPQIAALAAALGTSEESSVIGGERLSLAGATVLNGFLITAVTMCDAHRATLTHVTPEVIPPAFAIAERDDLTGRDLLVAIAAGFEVTTRIGVGHTDREVSPMPRRLVWAAGGFARATELSGDPRISDRSRRRPVQRVLRWRETRGRDRRPRQALGARADRLASVAIGVVDPRHEHGPVRLGRDAQDRFRQSRKAPHCSQPAHF